MWFIKMLIAGARKLSVYPWMVPRMEVVLSKKSMIHFRGTWKVCDRGEKSTGEYENQSGDNKRKRVPGETPPQRQS